jgi:wee1-like protein kinase
MSRFRADFVDLGCIARGGFSKVHKVIGRLDGCHYALKRSDRKLQSEREKTEALREVQVMASMVACSEIVRYQSAWWENDHLYIQMELGESTASTMVDTGERMNNATLLRLLHDISRALAFAHERGVAHMDVKPDNIFFFKGGFKLGDWGRVAQLGSGEARDWAVDEGDARYLSAELLQDDFSALDRADIFSLGATIYELALGTALPSHGAEYQALRQGSVPRVSLHPVVYALAADAMAPDPRARPSAAALATRAIQDTSLCESTTATTTSSV